MNLSSIATWREGLSPQVVSELVSCEIENSVKAGETLYSCGDPAIHGFFIKSGRIEVNSVTESGRKLIVGVFKPGQTMGDLALVGTEVRINNAIALEDATVTLISRFDYERLCRSYPQIALNMGYLMARRFLSMHARIQDANLLVLHEQVGRCIVRLGIANGRRLGDGSLLIQDCTHDMLAEMVGSVRQSIGRELKKMEADGLLVTEYRGIRILDPDRMYDVFGRTIDYDPLTHEGRQKL